MPILAPVDVILLIQVDSHQHAAKIISQFIVNQPHHVTIYVFKHLSEILLSQWANFVQPGYFQLTS